MDLVFKGGHYLKEILILSSFSFEDMDPRFTRLKPGLVPRLLSKGLFYIRVMKPSRDGIRCKYSLLDCRISSFRIIPFWKS